MPVALIAELSHRRVFRALVGYAVVSFAILQVIEPVMHGLHWPDAVLSYVVVALAIGFPVVIMLAWVFDVERAPGATTPRLAMLLVGIGVLCAVPGLIWYFVWPGRARAPVEAVSIAVLPFANLSSEKENEHFADGITEELINALTNVEGLRVASRTSVYALRARNLDAREIGDRLQVSDLVEGSVRREGSALRVTAQLVRVGDDVHLWSQTYDRELKGVFALEDEIARSIAVTLRRALAPRAIAAPTESSDAHDLYLEARHFSASRTGESLRKAEALYARAVQTDPGYALAWVGLAEVRALRHQYDETAADTLPLAKDAALRALAIDPRVAQGHAVLGLVAFFAFDWAEAERTLRKAIELNPRYPSAHHWYSLTLSNQGRFAEAYAETDRAYRLDPTSPIVNNLVGFTRFQAGDFEGAIEAFERAFEIAPSFSPSHGYLGELYAVQHRFAEAEAEYAQAGIPGYADRGRGVMYALAGRREEATRLAASTKSVTARGIIEFALGEKDRGYAHLMEACAARDPLLWDVKVDPLFATLRADPRFHEVLRCVHLE